MTGLALRSLRHRSTAFTATFVTVLLGSVLIGSFATLVETATGSVSDADAESLMIMGAVVGGWGALIVLFSVASTMGITVRQRAVEIGLLRTVGATPRQARRLIRFEALLVTAAAAAGGAALAWPAGRGLLATLRSGGMVSDDVEYGGGPSSLSLTAAGMVLTAMVATAIAGRRAVRGPATLVLSEGRAQSGRMRWWRVAAGLLMIAYGAGLGVVTITVMADDPDPYAAMQTSGSAAILVGLGMATLAPVLLRWAGTLARRALGASAAGHLAAYNTTRRSHLLAGVLAPVIVLTSTAVGVLMLVGIDGRTIGVVPDGEEETINLLNNVVTGMIALFAAIMVINAFAAVIADRRLELHRLRLVGATPEQVRGSVLAESAIVAATGALFGLVASLATVVPFAVARDEGVVPDGQLWLPPLIVAGVVALTLAAARGALRRATTVPVR
jgi:putative ABC transport system permease protein